MPALCLLKLLWILCGLDGIKSRSSHPIYLLAQDRIRENFNILLPIKSEGWIMFYSFFCDTASDPKEENLKYKYFTIDVSTLDVSLSLSLPGLRYFLIFKYVKRLLLHSWWKNYELMRNGEKFFQQWSEKKEDKNIFKVIKNNVTRPTFLDKLQVCFSFVINIEFWDNIYRA